MPNSTIQLQEIVDDAASLGDTSPALATGGYSDAPALSIANDVMLVMINGGAISQPYNWKWNRFNVMPFCTISYQQDYFVPGVVNLGWMESAWGVNINQTSIPKQKGPLEVRKDLLVTYDQTGSPDKISWQANDQMQRGTWGERPLGPTTGNLTGDTGGLGTNPSGLQNPGPNVIYTNPLGQIQNPINATTCIADPNGTLWVLTTFGTCGATQPTWPAANTVVYPTPALQNIVATTQTDGSCVWTAVNPKGQGLRLNPIPPQSGIVWQIQVVGQMRSPRFTKLAQTLEPIPDDFSNHFKQGFFAECYRRNPDPKIRSKYPMERQIWLETLDRAVRQSDREMDDVGFYPGTSVMDQNWQGYALTPAYPWPA